MIRTVRVVAAIALFALCGSATALQQRSFVSSSGSDSNNCQLSTPCRSFGVAIAHTIAGGEVIALDSAGYGPVSITQSISLIAPPGVYAGISVSSGDGISIGGAGIDVVLRGIVVRGIGGTTGIHIGASNEVHIESVVVSGMLGDGISFDSQNAVLIKDSLIRDNGGNGVTQGSGYATYDRVRFERNGSWGLVINSGVAAVTTSVFHQNLYAGIIMTQGFLSLRDSQVHGHPGGGISVNNASTLEIVGCVIEGNIGHGGLEMMAGVATIADTAILRNQPFGVGVVSGNGPTLATLNGVTLSHNGKPYVIGASGTLKTMQNNTIEDNDLAGDGALMPAALK